MRKLALLMACLSAICLGTVGLWIGPPRIYPVWSESTVITFTPKCGWKHVGLCINREGNGVGYGLFFQEAREEIPFALVWEPPFSFWIQEKKEKDGWPY